MTDSDSTLIALDPPLPPRDLIQSALHLPLSSIDEKRHRGRKLRFIGQILGFDIRSSLLLLAAPPRPSNGNKQRVQTILVNISIPLLGQSPAISDLSSYKRGYSLFPPEDVSNQGEDTKEGNGWDIEVPVKVRDEGGFVNREKVRLEYGEFVSVIGWLEGSNPLSSEVLRGSSSYDKPLGVVLEAIHISMADPPKGDELYRGEIDVRVSPRPQSSMKEDTTGRIRERSKRQDITAGASARPGNKGTISKCEPDDEEATPRPKRVRGR